MKKISTIFLCLLTLILITGCVAKERTLVCTTTETDDDMDNEQVISMTYKGNKLKHMKMEVNIKVKDSDVKNNWNMFKEEMDKNNQEFDKDGLTLKVESDDKNYEYKTTLDIDVENATEEALKEQGFDGIKDDRSTLEDSKKAAEKDGATCVIK